MKSKMEVAESVNAASDRSFPGETTTYAKALLPKTVTGMLRGSREPISPTAVPVVFGKVSRTLIFVIALLAGAMPACGGGGSSAKPMLTPVGEAGSSCGAGAAQSGTLISIADGKLQGKVAGKTREFLGIPFAKPPMGELRFMPPAPADVWTGTRDATAFGPTCEQGTLLLGSGAMLDEDCLSINVFTPEEDITKPLPVMVWIYGGGYTSGGSSQYDGQALSEFGHVLLVTFNYRVGALGFLNHAALDAIRPGAPSGNDGIRDQQLALRWVKDNIPAFGGDPCNVTVFGESAGGSSTCIHLISPGSRDLANHLIIESGPCGNPPYNRTRESLTGTSNMLVADLCANESDVVACLRSKSAKDITGWGSNMGLLGPSWMPSIDGPGGVIPDTPKNLIPAGNYNHGEFIIGANKNEMGAFAKLGLGPSIKTTADLESSLDNMFGAGSAMVKELYHPASDAEASTQYLYMQSDIVFRCPSRQIARWAADAGSTVYLYSFEQGTAYHGDDVPYVFGPGGVNSSGSVGLGSSTPDPMLVQTIQHYWARFAAAGDPNGDGTPNWPTYKSMTDGYAVLVAPPSASNGFSSSRCDFWAAHDDLVQLAIAKLGIPK